MPDSPQLIALDTSFLIRLLGKHFPLHDEANSYFDSLIEKEFVLAVPVVAVGEYVVRGNKEDLPYRNIQLLPYNLEQALVAGNLARHLFAARSAGSLAVDQRSIIPNDVKIFATAEVARVRAIITADKESQKLYSVLQSAGLVNFEWWHIEHPLHEFLGELGL